MRSRQFRCRVCSFKLAGVYSPDLFSLNDYAAPAFTARKTPTLAIERLRAFPTSIAQEIRTIEIGRSRISPVPHNMAEKTARPEDLIRFWLGHANKSVTDVYSKLKDDVTFRKKVAEQVGIGFGLPGEKREVAPNCTQSELLSTSA